MGYQATILVILHVGIISGSQESINTSSCCVHITNGVHATICVNLGFDDEDDEDDDNDDESEPLAV